MTSGRLENAVYSGAVEHQRYVEHDHAFSYSIYMLWLRVGEVDDSSKHWPLISRKRFAPVSVVASDYLANRSETTLAERLAVEIKEKLGESWQGEAFMLAHPRHFGFVINPLAVYYCYGIEEKLEFIVGEITNTPWGERHCYVFDMRDASATRPKKFKFKKVFHVSPFLPMGMDYTWVMNVPTERLNVSIWNKTGDHLDFEAHLLLSREPLTRARMLRHLLLQPLMTVKVLFGIYWNAGVLYAIKRVRFYDHPIRTKEGSNDNNK